MHAWSEYAIRVSAAASAVEHFDKRIDAAGPKGASVGNSEEINRLAAIRKKYVSVIESGGLYWIT